MDSNCYNLKLSKVGNSYFHEGVCHLVAYADNHTSDLTPRGANVIKRLRNVSVTLKCGRVML